MTLAPELIWISSHVADGRVGNSIAVFALQCLRVNPIVVPTVLLPAVPGPSAPPGIAVEDTAFQLLLDGLLQYGSFQRSWGVHTGYFRSTSHIDTVITEIAKAREANQRLLVSVDPILGDGGRLYVPQAVADALTSQLVPLADILFPNTFELSLLTKRTVDTIDGAITASRSLNTATVVVTSVPTENPDETATLLVTKDRAIAAISERFETAPNGTGDLLSALCLAHLSLGADIQLAMVNAVNAVTALIEAANQAASPRLPIVESQELLSAPPQNCRVEIIDA